MNKRLGLYLHIPFCVRKCGYCDFYSVTQTDLTERFADVLCSELREAAKQAPELVDSVFFGGGTPSLIPPKTMARIFDALRDFPICENAEISMEVNPATASLESFKAYRALGFNRVSVGMQSASDEELGWLGRIHTHKDTCRTVSDLKKAGFENFNLDLIYGIEGQSETDFLSSVKSALELCPTHLSLYALTLSESVPLYERRAYLASDQEQERQYLSACEALEEAGYAQYEISNFSRVGKECRHNLKYWLRAPYLGFGPGASSFYRNRRYERKADLCAYLDAPPDLISDIQKVSPLETADALCEELILSLRLCRGIDYRAFAARTKRPEAFLMETDRLVRAGLAMIDEKRLKLNGNGFFVSNEILARLLIAAGL